MVFRATGILSLLIYFSMGMAFPQHINNVDSLETILHSSAHDTIRIQAGTQLAKIYLKNKNLPAAEELMEKSFLLAKQKDLPISYNLHWLRAEVLFRKDEIQKAQAEMEIVLKILTNENNIKTIAQANNFIAMLYLYGGHFSMSIEAYEKNITYIKQNKLEGALPEAYYGLSNVYKTTRDAEEQRKSLLLMADASIKTNNLQSAAGAYYHLGDIGMEIDSNFSYAIDAYKKSLGFYKELQDTSMTSFLLLRIGWNHYLNKELDTALDYFFYSLEYSIPIHKLTSITNAYGNIGTIYRDKKEYDKAIKFYKKSIEYSFKAKDWYNLSWLYLDMSVMNKDLGDFKQAYENHVLHKKFSDSLEMKKHYKTLTDAQTKYEAEQAKKELELVSLKLNQHKYFTYGFGGLIFLVLVIGFLGFRQIRINSKRKISEMNHKISEVTQKNLRQQMNPHFIFNTLNSIQYYMYQHDKISTNNYLTKFSLLMRKTLENSQHTSIPIKEELDALELYLELEALRFKEKFEYSVNVDDDIDTLLLKIPTMLIQPYVENSICHGLVNKEEKGFVRIDLNMADDMLVCIIEDNGIGRKAAMDIKNQKNGNHNSLGTKITESRLNLVNSLYGKSMRIDYKDITDQSGKAAGTKVKIYIPIMT